MIRKPVKNIQPGIAQSKNLWKMIGLSLFSIGTLLFLLFILGLSLTVWEIKIYQHTIILVAYPILLWLSPGLLLTPALYNYLKDKIKTDSLFLHFVYNTGTWGGIVVFSFMAINFYGAGKTSDTMKLSIMDKGHLAKGKNGCGEPYADVMLNGKVKQLVFSCDDDIDMDSAVVLTVNKGLLGFDIVSEQKVVKN